MRRGLKLTKWNNKFVAADWTRCDPAYCHVRPARFVELHGGLADHTLFTVVRNPFDRLVSAWAYGAKYEPRMWPGVETFPEFVRMLHANRHDLGRVPMCWMAMPYEAYFAGVIDRVRVFRMEALDEAAAFVKEALGVELRADVRVNATVHAPWQTYYDDDLRRLVAEMYAWEIARWYADS
jgi:hypothetical protein